MLVLLFRSINGINVSVCGLIPHDDCWSVNRVLINELKKVLKYLYNIDSFTFIFQDHGWIFATNCSLDCSLFYKDFLHLIGKSNVKLTKSITLTKTSQYTDINLSSTNSNTSYSDIIKQKVQSTISFSLNEPNFPSLSNICQPVLSNVSESRLHQRKLTNNVKSASAHESFVYSSVLMDSSKH